VLPAADLRLPPSRLLLARPALLALALALALPGPGCCCAARWAWARARFLELAFQLLW
jgi:hypothetical protein